MKKAVFWVALILLFLLVCTCDSEKAPSSLVTNSRQVELINTQLDLVHEEVAAVQSPGGWALLALVVSIAVPLLLAIILLVYSGQSSLHSDEIIRQVARHGLTQKLIDTERLLDSTPAKVEKVLPSIRRLMGSTPEEHREKASESEEAEDEPA